MKTGPRVDLGMYGRAIGLLVRHPSIVVLPLLGGLVDMLIQNTTPLFTDAVGGLGAGIFQMLAQLIYLWAFGVAIIQASNIWRGRKGSFDEAWEEGRTKFGGILLAAIGFQFVIYAAQYAGAFVGPIVGLLLEAVAAFFLIYTIPAASIGGMPGSLAISASIRGVRANVAGSAVLAIVFFAIWFALIPIGLAYALVNVSPLVATLIEAGVRVVALAYLAFPFAKQYDDVAFRGFW
jgi:hypothetical protein